MRTMDSTGLWHLPDSPNEEVAGTLRYSSRTGITLSLIGAFRGASHGLEGISYPVIHGVITDSPYVGKRLVTLLRCFRRRGKIEIPGFESEEIRANRAYIGTDHLAGEDLVRFVSVRASYTHLSDWSGLTGFRNFATNREEGNLIARYAPPPAVQLHADDEHRLTLDLDWTASTAYRRFEITERAQLKLTDVAGVKPEDALGDIVFPFGDLLTLAVNRPSPVEDIEFQMERTASDRRGESFNVLFQPVYQAADEAATSSPDMLFTWTSVGTRYPDLVQRWFSVRRQFAVALDLYFGLVYAPPAYLEIKFRLLVSALGLLIADRTPDHTIREALERLRHSLQSPGTLSWIDMLPSIDELALPDRVRALLASHGDLARVVGPDVGVFLKNLVLVNRRLFTRERPGEPPPPLHLMVERLAEVVRISILEHLGFAAEDIVAAMTGTRMYQYLANQNW